MALKLSSVAQAPEARRGDHFSARRLDLSALHDFVAPVVGFDHFRMSGPTFPPHPHAGFSAVSYVFEDSASALHNRDSLGHDLIARPGDVVWTQAGSGVIHEEVPASPGVVVHGLQLFVNLSAQAKHLPPQAFHAAASTIPILSEEDGNRVRILSGKLHGQASPIAPAEPFDLFDLKLCTVFSYRVQPRWNALVYVVSGSALVLADGQERAVGAYQAIGARGSGEDDVLQIVPHDQAHVLLLAGRDPNEPVAMGGPFIMNTEAELNAAYARYRGGLMGHLD